MPRPVSVPSHIRQPPFRQVLPVPVFFRVERMPANATYPTMTHPWGEFVYSFSGVTEVTVGDQHFLAPPHLALWVPPGTEHTGFNHHETVHCSVYIETDLCDSLPRSTCALLVTPFVKAILDALCEWSPGRLVDAEGQRALRVLVDQLVHCEQASSFMPTAQSPALAQVLQALRDHPADDRPNSELARAHGMSERTLVRRSTDELGMSLAEWRQRLKLIHAFPLLRAGRSVESVAFELGYATSSAFIAMFRRHTGVSPGAFRGLPQPGEPIR